MSKILHAKPGRAVTASSKVLAAFSPISLKKYGFTRNPAGDFEDDGNHFKGYIFDNKLPMSYLKADGQVYISFDPDELGLNYEEYSKVPAYADADKYNGVPADEVDPADLKEIATNLLSQLEELKGSLGEVGSEDLEQYFADAQLYNQKVYQLAEAEIRSHLGQIIDNGDSYATKNILKWAKSLRRDANRKFNPEDVNPAQARKLISPENLAQQEAKYANPEDNWYYKEILENIEKLG